MVLNKIEFIAVCKYLISKSAVVQNLKKSTLIHVGHLEILCVLSLTKKVLQNTCNTALELRAQCLPYMESSEFRAFHIRKVQSSEV